MKKIGLLLFFFLLIGCTKATYKVQFVDWDGLVIEEYILEKNAQIIAPDAPLREGYIFIGWDQEFNKATSNLIIKAQYESETFTVTFIGYNNEVLKEETVAYGQDATAPNVTNPKGFTFTKWDKTFTNVKSNLTINAEFRKLTYTVTFIGLNGEVLKEEIVPYGDSATAPEVEGNSEYQFSGWDKDFHNVQSNLEVNAIFEERRYNIKFYDDKTELFFDVSSYKPGDDFALPLPTKSGYEFVGWFLSDISLYQVERINNKLTGDLKLYSRWVKTAQDILTAPAGALEFDAINKNPHSSGNGYVYQPKFPSGSRSISVLQYKWASSNEKVATISSYSSISIASAGYAIITATLISDPTYVLYCVIKTLADGVTKVTLEEANSASYVYATFNMEDGTTVKKIVAKGGYVIPPTATPKDGYTFVGWKGLNGESIYNINQDTTYEAKYVLGDASYLGKTVSVLGDSITTYAGYIPEGFAHFYPYPTADLGDVNQTWWMQIINHYGMKLLVNNSWSGSAVSGSEKSAAQNKDRLKHLLIGDVTPDVIIIFMGANDAPSPYISLSQFDSAYGIMIANIKDIAPEAEIIVCTLPNIELYSAQNQVDYNNVIKKHANDNGFKIIDFTQAFTREEASQYLVDKAHPNKAGMDRLANVAINDLIK